MKFTGERVIPEKDKIDELYLNHLVRYSAASLFVKNQEVLDIACGSGYGSKDLLDKGAKKVIGIDISKEAINYCKSKYKDKTLSFQVGTVDKIPLNDNSLDVVVSLETLEHVDEKTQILFLREVKRVLKKKGVFIVSTPNRKIFKNKGPFHKNELTLKGLNEFLSEYFKNLKILYQGNYESALLLDSKQLEVKGGAIDATLEKYGKINHEEAKYFLAICSDEDIKIKSSTVLLSPIKVESTLTQKIKEQNEGLKNKALKREKSENELTLILRKKNKWIKKLEEDIVTLKEEIRKNEKNQGKPISSLGKKIKRIIK